MYIPNNAASISIAIVKLIVLVADRKIIVPARPVNETTMPATIFSVLLTTMGFHHHMQSNELHGPQHGENASNTQEVLTIAPIGKAWHDKAHRLHNHDR